MNTEQRKIKLNKPVAFGSGEAVTELACREISTLEFIENDMPFVFKNGQTIFPPKQMVKYLSLMTGIDEQLLLARFKVLEINELALQIVPFLETDLGGDEFQDKKK